MYSAYGDVVMCSINCVSFVVAVSLVAIVFRRVAHALPTANAINISLCLRVCVCHRSHLFDRNALMYCYMIIGFRHL